MAEYEEEQRKEVGLWSGGWVVDEKGDYSQLVGWTREQ